MDSLLERYAPGFERLREEEKQTIYCFAVLWSVFEATNLDTNASAHKIKEKTRAWENIVQFDNQWFIDSLNYFTDRYINKITNDTNSLFTSLNLNDNDVPLVKSVLKMEAIRPSEQLAACLIIVYRFRNNFFHGMKWSNNMRDQKDNFDHSINLMKDCIDRFSSI